MPSVGPPQRRPVSRPSQAAAVLAVALLVLAIGGVVFGLAGRSGPDATISPSPSIPGPGVSPSFGGPVGTGYLTSADELKRRAEMGRRGQEPQATAMKDLLAEADAALVREPQPRNPLTWRQNGRFLPDTQDAYTLALAWVVSNDERYARRAAEFITAWVSGVDQTSDTCTDRGGSDCATSLLVSRAAPGFVFAADLLHGSGALSVDDESRLKSWLTRLILPAASERTNNWGDAGNFMRLAVAAYIGDGAEFNAAIDGWRAGMDMVTSEGQIPEETRRGSLGLLYTQGAISFKVGAAAIAERRGINLWDYHGKNGGTLRLAVDTLARYWVNPKSWPWHKGHLEIPNVDPAWELIYHRWPDPAFARIFGPARPLGPANTSAIIWTTLTRGEPLQGSASMELVLSNDATIRRNL